MIFEQGQFSGVSGVFGEGFPGGGATGESTAAPGLAHGPDVSATEMTGEQE